MGLVDFGFLSMFLDDYQEFNVNILIRKRKIWETGTKEKFACVTCGKELRK